MKMVHFDDIEAMAKEEWGADFVLDESNLTETVDFFYGTMAASVAVMLGHGSGDRDRSRTHNFPG